MIRVKNMLTRGLIIASLAISTIGVASACEWQPGPFGPICEPICRDVVVDQVWIQTGPFPGQGFWRPIVRRVCD